MQSQVHLAEKMVRFTDLLPHDGEITLIVLKGHLLIEELLTELSQLSIDMCTNPIDINITDRTSFHQKLIISWSLNREGMSDLIWNSLKLLNEIRNRMAHSVEPNGIDIKIQKFISAILDDSPFQEINYKDKELEFSISWLFILVSNFLHDKKNEEM